jgi:hypothetical protein
MGSIPFAVLGAVTGQQLYPGIPVSALGFVASILRPPAPKPESRPQLTCPGAGMR